jgi:hypothetical protein
VESRDDSGDHLFDPHGQDHVIHAISVGQRKSETIARLGWWDEFFRMDVIEINESFESKRQVDV